MGFSIDKITGTYKNKIQQQSVINERKEKSPINERNFDKILIQSNQSQIEEKKLSEGLSKKVMTDVKREVSNERVSEISSLLERGQYEINNEEIANRILSLEGVELYE